MTSSNDIPPSSGSIVVKVHQINLGEAQGNQLEKKTLLGLAEGMEGMARVVEGINSIHTHSHYIYMYITLSHATHAYKNTHTTHTYAFNHSLPTIFIESEGLISSLVKDALALSQHPEQFSEMPLPFISNKVGQCLELSLSSQQ